MVYAERESSIDGAVVWTGAADGGDSWILPDGCMDLIWDGASLFVAGPDTVPFLSRAEAGTRYAAIRLAPGAGPNVFGVPAEELRNRRAALDELWPPGLVARVVDRLHAAEDLGLVLEDVAAQRLSESPVDPLLAEVVHLVKAGRSISEVANKVGLSDRQLHRRSLLAFGYGPKMLARILRLQRALALARIGVSFARTAAEAGYADQAHLAREARALAGAPLTQLI